MKRSVCLYFKVHQPFQLKEYVLKDIDVCHSYEDEAADEIAINELADQCYLPANKIVLSNIHNTHGQFKISYSISGTALELLQKYRPDVIESFKDLVKTGSVEILSETYYHSLSFLHSKKEFKRQVEKHSDLVKKLFNADTKIFRNTELIYNNDLAGYIHVLGFKGILCEGIERILKGRTCNQLYAAPGAAELPLFLRNPGLSDDIAFRFDDNSWSEHPLTADKFAEWLNAYPPGNEVVNLFMDYETFGVHKKNESGIFDFLAALPVEVLAKKSFQFSTPSEVIEQFCPHDVYDVPETISREDESAACCVWCENARQNNSLRKIYSLEKLVTDTHDRQLTGSWGRLQAADYFYYMADENVKRNYPNKNHTPKQVHEYYSNMVTDLEITLIKTQLKKHKLNFIPQTHNVY